ncbi:MAG TPA: recombinase family protein, partial [Cyclobacteriaceae bacterium]|nr:recombinase family protein [Cyclobacteriaceae bacterium]HRF35293.1 recombinase family protein [Cyclobacteriaceae bacterium]
MKKKAILYVRVSTDEQAEKGYSLADQEERLIRHCERNGIEPVGLYREDYSAKTMQRPALTELREYVRKNKHDIDQLLFVKWDRFSRNIRDSYYLIDEFRKMAVETCAIEQPLDLNVPESKIMLAIYVATPEVENDRRSLNTTRGMRRARKTGRWVSTAPLGYRNSRDENNKPVIIPDKNARLVTQAFKDLSMGVLRIEEVRRKVNLLGLKCGRSQFNRLVRNPVYIGKIFIPEALDEPEQIVKGLHEPIIDENTFWQVQEIINGRKPKTTTKIKSNDLFPLRGFLQCSQCGATLTGSSSRGRLGKRYSYYHCANGCTERLPAQQVNADFVQLFRDISTDERMFDLYTDVLSDLFKRYEDDREQRQLYIEAQIEKNNKHIEEAMDMMMEKQIGTDDYKLIKARYDEKNLKLLRDKVRLQDIGSNGKYMRGCVKYLKSLEQTYLKASTPLKKIMVGSIFEEKLVYEKTGYRTPKYTPVVECITLKNNELEKIKTGMLEKNFEPSGMVVPAGIEPASSESESEIL